MTREEYAKRMKKHPDWAPGRDAIEAAFAKRYPNTEPVCFESELHDRAAFGGDEYLDGFAVYDTGKGYQHIVTYGMSEGRQAINSFNVYTYRSQHPDLEQRFGDNLRMYYLYACGLA